jgi:hypothetical protein
MYLILLVKLELQRYHGGNANPDPRFANLAAPACVSLPESQVIDMLKFLLWCILFVICWPLALVALVIYPIVWLLLLPFRIAGIAVGSVLVLIWALVTLPVRVVERVL